MVFDDLAASRPAKYTWLYHILPEGGLAFDPARFAVDYQVGDVKVRLQHMSQPQGLVLDDRRGLDGLVNPLTAEDYRRYRKDDILCEHNLWVTNQRPAKDWTFLTVVYPIPPGGSLPGSNALTTARFASAKKSSASIRTAPKHLKPSCSSTRLPFVRNRPRKATTR